MKIVEHICAECFDAIRKAAYDNMDRNFEGCYAVVNLPGTSKANIEIDVDGYNNFTVLVDHKSNNESSLLEETIKDYLYDNNADPLGQLYIAKEEAFEDYEEKMKELC
jgi:hypothetical protein